MCIHKMRRAGALQARWKSSTNWPWWDVVVREKVDFGHFLLIPPWSSNGSCYTFNSWSHSYWCCWTLKRRRSHGVLWSTRIFSSSFSSGASQGSLLIDSLNRRCWIISRSHKPCSRLKSAANSSVRWQLLQKKIWIIINIKLFVWILFKLIMLPDVQALLFPN